MFAVSSRFAYALTAAAFALIAASPATAQDTRTVTEPVFPAVCTVLPAQMAIVGGAPASELTPDTARIQAALTTCGAGKAVELSGAGTNFAFLSAPLNVPSGVSLIVDGGVTLFASRNREDYQTSAISASTDECGTQGPNGNGCKNFILFNNNSTNANSGIYGYGVIDGRGYATTLKAGVDTGISWWTNADSIPSGYSQNNPIIMKLSKSTNFTLYKITIRNSPQFHVGWSGTGFTAWGVKIQAPYTAHNTDGIDPQGTNVTVTNSSISDGDDDVAVGASSTSANVTISNTTTYSGHGISVGSYTQGGLSNMLVTNVNMAGTGADTNATGIRLKSAQDRGGLLQNITYQNMCLKDMHHILQFTPFYNSNAGTSIPQFSNVTLQNLHFLPPSTGAYAYLVALQGHDASHISTITLNNIIFDSLTQNNTTSTPPEYENFTLAGNVYPSFLQTLSGPNVTYTGTATSVATGAYDCTAATTFPYEVGELFLSTPAATNLQTGSTTNVAGFTLSAMLQPATATAAYSGTTGNWAGAAAMTKPVNFLEGSTVVGTGTLGANGANSTLATLKLTGVTPGTHTYTAQYPGDSNYGLLNFGKVVVTVTAGAAAPTSTSLTATPGSAPYGASTTLTAAVTTAAGTPTGSITFLDGNTTLATVALASGSAATTQVLGGGNHSLTAVYSGDTNYLTSTSTAATVTITASGPTPSTIAASPANFTLGTSTTLTATFTRTGSGSTPTGTVNFYDGVAGVSAISLGSAALNASGVATITFTPTTAGVHTESASYSGDINYSSTQPSVAVTVAQAQPTVTLTLTGGGTYGNSTTLSVAVAPPSGTATIPTGTVNFFDGTTQIASVTLVAGTNNASVTLLGGTHTLTAAYGGDVNFISGTSTVVSSTIAPQAAPTTLTASPATLSYPSSTTFTVSILRTASTVALTGTINILEGGAIVASGTPTGAGVATITLAPAVGTHSYTAAYLGDTNYAATTTTAITVVVSATTTSTTLTLSAATAYLGAYETFTATVTSPNGIPSGTVNFIANPGTTSAGSLGTATLNASGIATLTLAEPIAAMYPVAASFVANGGYLTSTSPSQTLSIVVPFTTSVTTTNVTLAPGHSAVSTLTAVGSSIYAGNVVLTCSSPVPYLTCTLSPTTIALSGPTPATSAITLSVAATVASQQAAPFAPRPGNWLALLFPLGMLGLLGSRNRRLRMLSVLIVAAAFVALSGCGSSASANTAKLPPAGTQQVIVTANGPTTGGNSHTVTTIINVVITN